MNVRYPWQLVFVMALAGVLIMGCSKGKKVDKKPPASTDEPDDDKGDDPKPKANKGDLFDPAAFDEALGLPYAKHKKFAKTQKKIVEVAEACRKAKKSLTWCDDWKPYNKKLQKIFKKLDKNEPKTIKPAMAVTLAAVSKLRDESLAVRMAGLKVLDRTFYDFYYAKFKKYRPLLARVVANTVKNGKTAEERNLALRLLGHDGGTSIFQGGEYDGKVLAYAATKDKEKSVRVTALQNMVRCVKKIGKKCPLTKDELKEWIKAEKEGDAIEQLARLAGMLKMGDQVEAMCESRLLDSTFYWGCREGYKAILDKGRSDKFLALAEKYRESDKSKTAHDFRLYYAVELMVHGTKNGFPRDKAVAFINSVLSQKSTKNKRSKETTRHSVEGLAKLTKGKEQGMEMLKVVLKHQKKFKKKWKKDKKKKAWLKVFDAPLAKIMKEAGLDKKK